MTVLNGTSCDAWCSQAFTASRDQGGTAQCSCLFLGDWIFILCNVVHGEGQRHTHTHVDTHTDTHSQTQKHTHTHTHAHTHTQAHTHTLIHTRAHAPILK